VHRWDSMAHCQKYTVIADMHRWLVDQSSVKLMPTIT